MSNTLNLLQQVRYAASVVSGTSENPEHLAMLASTDLILNELLLQETPDFYIDYIEKGKPLLSEGQQLAQKNGVSLGRIQLRDDLSPEFRNEIFDGEIQKLHDALTAVVKALSENRSLEEKDYLNRLSSWESSLYAHRGEQVVNTTVSNAEPLTQEMLQVYLEKKFPEWTDVNVTQFTTLYGGFSKKTILFETEDKVNGSQSLVLRVEQPVDLLCYDGSDVAQEYYMIKLMHKLGLPVAEALWLEEDASYLGGRFIASVKAPGRVVGDSLGGEGELPQELVDAKLAALFQLHNTDLDRNDTWAIKSHLQEWLHCETITECTEHCVNVFVPTEIERTGISVTPDVARGLKWLQNNVPECNEEPVLLHMDFSFNNLLFDGNQVSAVLDWETSRIGDPVDDIIWTQQSVENLIPMAEFLDRYKQATGGEVSPYRIAYSWVLKSVLTTIGTLSALQSLNLQNDAPIHFSFLAYKYMPLLCVNLNGLIAAAEAVKE